MKILKKIIPVIVFVIVVGAVYFYIDNNKEANKISIKDEENISYNTISENQKLDIYFPSKVYADKNPVVIYLHGGSYSFGKRTEFVDRNKEIFTKNGYIYVPVDYRLRTDKTYPAAVNDVKTAIRYLKENKSKYKIDADKIFVMGHSVGANLASIVASTSGIESLSPNEEEVFKYDKNDSRIAGLIGIAGFYDINTFLTGLKNKAIIKGAEPKILKHLTKYYNLDVYDSNNPLIKENNFNYLKNLKVPIFLQHGINDRVVDFQETTNYCSAIKYRTDNPNVHCELISNTGHNIEPFLDEINASKIIKWLDLQAKNEK